MGRTGIQHVIPQWMLKRFRVPQAQARLFCIDLKSGNVNKVKVDETAADYDLWSQEVEAKLSASEKSGADAFFKRL